MIKRFFGILIHNKVSVTLYFLEALEFVIRILRIFVLPDTLESSDLEGSRALVSAFRFIHTRMFVLPALSRVLISRGRALFNFSFQTPFFRFQISDFKQTHRARGGATDGRDALEPLLWRLSIPAPTRFLPHSIPRHPATLVPRDPRRSDAQAVYWRGLSK